MGYFSEEFSQAMSGEGGKRSSAQLIQINISLQYWQWDF